MYTILPTWAQWARQLQNYPLVNKAVVEGVGVDIPTIGLARNPIERKELIFEQALTFFLFFMAAPAHAWGYRKLAHKAYKLPAQFMDVAFTELKSLPKFKAAIKQLPDKLARLNNETLLPWQKPKPFTKPDFSHIKLTDTIRKNVLKAKTWMWTLDLITVCGLTGSIGFAKNVVGKLLSGTKHFTGEIGVVDQKQLDELYYKQPKEDKDKSQSKKSSLGKGATVYAASVIFPAVTGALMWAACKKTHAGKGIGKAFMRGMGKLANHLDHRRGIFISLASLFGAATVFNIGLFSAARSPNERREVLMKKVPMQTTFFLGDLVLMFLANYRYLKKRGIKPTSHIETGIQRAAKPLKKTVGKRLAKTFWGMFALNTAMVGSLVVLNNWLTTKRVKQQAATQQVANTWLKNFNWQNRPLNQ